MKNLITILIILLSFMLVACGVPEKEYEEEKQVVDDEKTIDKTFIGDFGYIIENNTYDYSNRFETTYEWMENVKLPIDKIKDSKVYYENNALFMADISFDVFKEYINDFKEAGYCVEEEDKEYGLYKENMAYIYKDNLSICMRRMEETPEEEDVDKVFVYIFTGNVKGTRKVNIDEARMLLSENEEFIGNEYFEKYILIEIANETVADKGYYEFIAFTPETYGNIDRDSYPYYFIIDGEQIIFCKQLGQNRIYPASVNLTKENKLIVTYTNGAGRNSGASYYGYVEEYWLEDGKFVLKKKTNSLYNTVVIGSMDNGEVKFWKMKQKDAVLVTEGGKNLWEVEESLDITY